MSHANNVSSIYIPRVSTNWTESAIRKIMKDNRIGIVSRVDFTPTYQLRGFRGDDTITRSKVVSAFVHFASPHHCEDGNYYWSSKPIWDVLFWTSIAENTPYKIQVSRKEYWVCLKNNRVAPHTRMNIHQVVDNCSYLEAVVDTQAREITALKKDVENIQYVVYQLLGGLFCQTTQSRGLETKTNILLSRKQHDGLNEVHVAALETEENIWPTTRQGDENTEKIKILEERINELEEWTAVGRDLFKYSS